MKNVFPSLEMSLSKINLMRVLSLESLSTHVIHFVNIYTSILFFFLFLSANLLIVHITLQIVKYSFNY